MTHQASPADLRVDTWIERGTEVTAYYDPMLAKLIAHGSDRADAIAKLSKGLAVTHVDGLESNLEYLRAVMSFAPFADGMHTTRSLASFSAPSRAFDVLSPGVQTSVQDWPGRLGYWDVGVPPSGPMDPLALRLANRLLGNEQGAAGLEITVAGPSLRFRCPAVVAVCGAPIELSLDGKAIPMGRAVTVEAGQNLRIGRVGQSGAAGCRAYLAVAGGIDVPEYLGSGSTFTLGQLGGHGGRVLRADAVARLMQVAWTSHEELRAALDALLDEAEGAIDAAMVARVLPHLAGDGSATPRQQG